MKVSKLRAALIGTGSVAHGLHIRAHQRLDRSVLSWVCDTNGEAAESFARTYGIPHWTTGLEEVLQAPDVDWIDIATPNGTHKALAVRALQAGKHVLCQKPLATSVTDAKEMIGIARQAGRQLGIYMSYRGDQGVHLLKEWMDDGKFGRMISLRAKTISGGGLHYKAGMWRMVEAAGALNLLGVHMIDLFLWLGGEARWVQAYSNTLHAPIAGDDVTTAIYGWDNGVTAVLETSICSFVNDKTPISLLEINGTEGWARYRLESGELVFQLSGDAHGPDCHYRAGEIGTRLFPTFHSDTNIHRIHRDFVQSIQAGTPVALDGTIGCKALQIMEATLAAAKEGKRTGIAYA